MEKKEVTPQQQQENYGSVAPRRHRSQEIEGPGTAGGKDESDSGEYDDEESEYDSEEADDTMQSPEKAAPNQCKFTHITSPQISHFFYSGQKAGNTFSQNEQDPSRRDRWLQVPLSATKLLQSAASCD